MNCLKCHGVMILVYVDADGIDDIRISIIEALKCQSCSSYYWLSIPSEIKQKRPYKKCLKKITRNRKKTFLGALNDIYKIERVGAK